MDNSIQWKITEKFTPAQQRFYDLVNQKNKVTHPRNEIVESMNCCQEDYDQITEKLRQRYNDLLKQKNKVTHPRNEIVESMRKGHNCSQEHYDQITEKFTRAQQRFYDLINQKNEVTHPGYEIAKYMGKGHNCCQEHYDQFYDLSNHPNIIELLHRPWNVPKFKPEGTLHDHLHRRKKPLMWLHRKNIAIGVAKALKILHQTTNDGSMVIYNGINAKDILLDYYLQPKVSNFGSAAVLKRGFTKFPILACGGEKYIGRPYFSQENLSGGKIDVFAFGLLLLELITGKQALDGCSFPEWVVMKVKNEGSFCINPYIDTKLNGGAFSRDELDQMIILAQHCLSLNSIERPTANQIVEALEGKIHLASKWNNENDHISGGEARPSQRVWDLRKKCEELRRYKYVDIALATESFSNKYLLGVGGFGHVYKATLFGETVAAKRFFPKGTQNSFKTEMSALTKLEHPNLLKILGYCSDSDNNKLLVLEFMPNKSLAAHLHVDNPILDWKKRRSIAIDTAKAIAYLHASSPEVIIHRDIKPENILLSDDFKAKIADFGLAKFMAYDESHISTNAAGTNGYVAPECKGPGKPRVTEKADVFSYGILLLEFITGRRPVFKGTGIFLSEWAWEKLKHALSTGSYTNLVDFKLDQQYDIEEMCGMIYCAAACVYKPEKSRPTMKKIADVLEGKLKKEVIWQNKVDVAWLHSPYQKKL